MPNKSRKDKESSKSGKSNKSGSKHQNSHDSEKEGSNKRSSSAPPSAQLMRVKQSSSQGALKKERRLSASCFPISTNRELHKLPPFKGTHLDHFKLLLCRERRRKNFYS
ncbi:hypothetical protein SRHO_G00131970 [Serrasalmus rhombeus]